MQSSPCCGIQTYGTYRSTRTGWLFGNVGSEHHLVMSASATIGRDLRLDTFKICVCLNKESEQSIDGKKVPLRSGLVGLNRPSRLTTRPPRVSSMTVVFT